MKETTGGMDSRLELMIPSAVLGAFPRMLRDLRTMLLFEVTVVHVQRGVDLGWS